MNKSALYFILFFIHVYSYANKPCPEVWNTKHNKTQQNYPELAKQILDRFYVKIEDIIPTIERTELKVLPETDSLIYNRYNRHGDNQYYKIAMWRGEKVFLKKIAPPQGEHELAVLRTFSHVGIPTLFRGVMRDTDGVLYMVSRFQDGGTLRNQLDVLAERVNDKHYGSIVQQLGEIQNVFSKIGIFPADFQFMVSKEGKVYLIDVEMYTFSGTKAGEKK